MNRRWQCGLSPFAGDCLVTDDLLSVEDLRTLLAVVVSDLQHHYATQALYTFDDWHQHDGYVTQRHMADWPSLTAACQSANALVASRQGDTDVHRSFYPEDLSFLLRYDVSDEETGDATGFSGTFDFSANSSMIDRIASLVPLGLRSRMRVEPSKGYFDRTYAG